MTIEIRKIDSDGDVGAAMPLMRQLRGDMIKEAEFIDDVRAQERQGYEMYGAYRDGTILGLAGIRRQRTMSRGWHLFVDDLVTDSNAVGLGVGTALMEHLFAKAKAENLDAVHLDSRATAKGFYEKLGFTFQSSIPCFKRF